MSVVALFYYIRLVRISSSYRTPRLTHLLELTGWGSVPLIVTVLANLSSIIFVGDWAAEIAGVLS